MKRAILCQVALVGLVGCGVETANTPIGITESAGTTQTSDANTALTFVSLKVPNMH